MARRFALRFGVLMAVLLAVSFLTFSMMSLLPGDPALQILGGDNADPERVATVRSELGLDDPFLVRYGDWLGGVVRGDFGRSYRTSQPVAEAIRERLPVTVEVGTLALLFALVASVPLGVLSAYRAGTRFDKAVSGISFGLLSVPSFMLAVFLMYVFAVRLRWLPASGWTRLTDDPLENLKSAVLPALSLAVAEAAVYTRLLRSDVLQTLQEDFLVLARMKGLPTWRILFGHALRPSSISLMTVIGVQLAALLGGTVIVEQVFALPGVGLLLINGIYQRDLLVVQGVVLVVASAFVIVNFLIDMLYTVVDTRIR